MNDDDDDKVSDGDNNDDDDGKISDGDNDNDDDDDDLGMHGDIYKLIGFQLGLMLKRGYY